MRERNEDPVRLRIGVPLSAARSHDSHAEVHPSRARDLLRPDRLTAAPAVPLDRYMDGFGNMCTRIVAPAGGIRLAADGLIHDTGLPDPTYASRAGAPVESLPHEALVYLLGSRYCETERLMDEAWRCSDSLPSGMAAGAGGVRFRASRTSPSVITSPVPRRRHAEAYQRAAGRMPRLRASGDHAAAAASTFRRAIAPAILATSACRAADAPMDFAGWFEAYIGGAWQIFDPRNNQRRIGRILIARGRDAADVAISTGIRAQYARGVPRLEPTKCASSSRCDSPGRSPPRRGAYNPAGRDSSSHRDSCSLRSSAW